MKNNFIGKIFTLVFFFFITVSSSNAQVNLNLSGGNYPTGVAMMGIAYGNGAYVAVGYTGNIIRSTDGVNWTVVKNSSWLNLTYSKVCYGNGQFVGIAGSGEIITSPDGITWTQRFSGVAGNIADVQYLNGKYFVIGTGVAVSSTDAITWTSFSIGAGALDNLTNILYVGGKYYIGVRVNSSGDSRCYSSTTGATGTWSSVLITTGGSLNKLLYLNNKFFALNSSPSVYGSTDGITWAVTGGARLASLNQIFTGFYDGTTYFLFGTSVEYSYCSVFTSTDGANFTLQPQNMTLTVQHAAYLNGRYFLVGNEGMVSSTNGTTWSFVSSTLNAVASNGTRYVAVGQNTSAEAAIQVSDDYATWTPIVPGVIKPLNGITYGNGKFVAVGSLNGTSSTYAVSTDGLSWTTGNTGIGDLLRAVAYGNNKYVAVGVAGRIIYSSNGTSWTSAESVAGYNYYGISFVNNYFVAVGGSVSAGGAAKVKYSADGITWTDVSPSPALSGHFHAVAYGGGKYMLVGRDNTTGVQKFFSMTSTDITTNTAYSAAATVSTPEGELGTLGYGAVAYTGGNFTAVANLKIAPFSAYVLTSAAGSSWTATAVGSTSRLRGLISVGSAFRSVGANPSAYLSVSIGATLPVKLLDFTGRYNSGQVYLDWTVTEETNTDRFEVEKGTDGRNFTYTGEVAALNTAGENSYQYIDADNKAGVRYYRIKMIDIDGKYTYSPAIRIQAAAQESAISVYPNPASDHIIVTLPVNQPASVAVFNNRGEKILQQKTEGNKPRINTSSLVAGIYVVQVTQGDKVYSEKMIKK